MILYNSSTNKIKKYQKKKKRRPNKNKIDPRISYRLIEQPSKFMNPYLYYKLYGDMILMEDNGLKFCGSAPINNFKLVSTVEYDKKLELTTVNMVDATNNLSAPWRYLTERLKSQNDEKLIKWADSIQSYCQLKEELMAQMTQIENSKYLSKLKANIKINPLTRDYYINKYPVLIQKIQVTEKSSKQVCMRVNDKFLDLLGYSFPLFCNYVFRKGIPNFYPSASEEFNERIMPNLDRVFNHDLCDDNFLTSAYLITKDGYLKPMLISIHSFISFHQKRGLEIEILIAYQEDNKKINIKTKSPLSDFEDEQRYYEKDVNEFLKKFYDPSYQEGLLKNADKVCGYRILTPFINQEEKIEFEKQT